MALEDEIINIEDLDIANEIKIGDYVLLETTDGTKLIDFKDFIIGTDNITFYDKISGGDFLQRADISDLSANVTTNTSILTDISSVSADIDSLQYQVTAALNDIVQFRASISNLSDVELSTNTSASVGMNASLAGNALGTAGPHVYFTRLDFKGSALAEAEAGNGTVNIGSASEGFSYTANGSYNIFLIVNINFKRYVPRIGAWGGQNDSKLTLLKNEDIIGEFTVTHSIHANASIIRNIRVVAGDKLTLFSGGRVIGGDISITVA